MFLLRFLVKVIIQEIKAFIRYMRFFTKHFMYTTHLEWYCSLRHKTQKRHNFKINQFKLVTLNVLEFHQFKWIFFFDNCIISIL